MCTMEKKRLSAELFHKKPLVEAIEITRENEQENPSLQMKLQEEMEKPLNDEILSAAGDMERAAKLKAPEAMKSESLLKRIH